MSGSAAGEGVRAGQLAFAYHRAVAPMMWVLVALSGIEIVVVHALIAFWLPWLAVLLSVLTLAGLIWLVLAIRSLKRLPVLLDGERVLMRAGMIKALAVPLEAIAAVRGEIARAEIDRRTLNLALIAHPNICLELRQPIALGRRRIERVAHRLDDPAGFTAALERLRRGGGAATAAA